MGGLQELPAAGARCRVSVRVGDWCSPSMRAVGATTDALVGALVATAVALGVRRRATLGGAAWAFAASLSGSRSCSSGSPRSPSVRGHVRRARSGRGDLAVGRRFGLDAAGWGLHWLGALGPLADNAVCRRTPRSRPGSGSWASPTAWRSDWRWPRSSRPRLLARDALGGRARLGTAACLVLARRPTSRSGTRLGGPARGPGGRRPPRAGRGARAHGVPAPETIPL